MAIQQMLLHGTRLVSVVLDFPDGNPFSNPVWTNNYNNTFGYWTMPSNILNNTLNITAIGAGAGMSSGSASAASSPGSGGDYVTRTVVLSPGTRIYVAAGFAGVAWAGTLGGRPYGDASGVLQWTEADSAYIPSANRAGNASVLPPNRICWAMGGYNSLGPKYNYNFGDYIELGTLGSGTAGGGAGNCGPLLSGQGGVGKNLNGTCGSRGSLDQGGDYGGGGGYRGSGNGGNGGKGAVRISFTSIE